MGWFRPKTLFGRTLATIALVSIGFQLFLLAVFLYYLLLPLGQRSAGDLAQLMLNRAQAWQTQGTLKGAPPRSLAGEQGLVIGDATAAYPVSDSWLPYRYFLERALEERVQHPVSLLSSIDREGNEWFWADLEVDGEKVRIGFPRERIGVHPPAAILLSLLVGVQVMLITAVLLVRRLTAPLERLSRAVRRLGSGDWPEPVPEEGPEELAQLARSFNRMTVQVRELLANRTTLLAGISHDLRTPLTQIRLALAMLPGEGGDPELMAGIQRDLNRIDALLQQFLELSRGLEQGQRRPVAVDQLIGELVEQFRRRGIALEWSPGCDRVLQVHPLSLQRIVTNLVENAVRYGGESGTAIRTGIDAGDPVVEVLDRGPGIPPEQREAVFRPFHRLEDSRSRNTGGSGLGLAVVKQLCQANGWSVRLASRPGGGTRVVLKLG